ncbi:hypothetical protein LCGC14_2595040 [marine sediment metagenome]|uniref:Uncharacterized protein n=1 Tax=marine sediment metagenome TaxID=412755 RepID=A0A0F9D350_9ZZZZ
MIKVFIKSLKMFGFVTGFSLGSTKQEQTGLDAQKKLVQRVVNVPVSLVMVALPDTLVVGPMQDMVPCLSVAEIEELMTSTPPPTEEELKEAEESETESPPEQVSDAETEKPDPKAEEEIRREMGNVQKTT